MRKSIFIVAALLIACNKNAAPPTTSSQTAAPPPAAQPAPTTAPASQPATATTAAAPTAGAIASTDGEKPGMHIDVTELKRASGGTVNLKFVLSNNTDKSFGMWEFLHEKGITDDAYDVSGVTLIDPVNKKKYFVVVDTEKNCVCSRRIDHVEPNTKMNLWAKYPAPPPDVQKVTLEFPHFQPIDDVSISQ